MGDGYGHIAIVYENINNSNFTSFDQNWNTPLLCNIEVHNYNNILGWIRKKGSIPPTPTPTQIKKQKFPWVIYTNIFRRKRNNF